MRACVLPPLLLVPTFARANSDEEIEALVVDLNPPRDDARRPLIAAASTSRIGAGSDWLAIDIEGGGLVLLNKDGEHFQRGEVITDPHAAATERAIRVQKVESQVSSWLSGLDRNHLDAVRPQDGFEALLGAACPDSLCGADRVDDRALADFPKSQGSTRHFGDVATSLTGDQTLFALNQDYFLVLGRPEGPVVATRAQLGGDLDRLGWRGVLAVPRGRREDLTPDQIKGIVSTLTVGLSGTIQVEAPPVRYIDPRIGIFSLGIEVEMFSDAAGLASGPGGVLKFGVPLRMTKGTTPGVVIHPFVGFGATFRQFPATTDGRYDQLDMKCGTITAGVRGELLLPAARGWWVLGLAPSWRADGVDVLHGTAQNLAGDLSLSGSYRWEHIGIGGAIGGEMGSRTAGLAATSSQPWEQYGGTVFSVETTLYFAGRP